MCHLKSRNVCHRYKETNSLPLIEFQPGFQRFLFLFFFLKLHCYEKREDYVWLRSITYFAKSCFPTKGRCFELFKYFYFHFASSRLRVHSFGTILVILIPV